MERLADEICMIIAGMALARIALIVIEALPRMVAA